MRRVVLLCFAVSLIVADDATVVMHPLRWRFGGESVALPGGERMGVAELVVDAQGPVAALPQIYAGVGTFAAISGDRGGFIVLGGDLGWRVAVARDWALDLGGFVGGGGGGAAPQGGGLMLRPYLGVEWTVWRDCALRGELAYVRFPDGDVASTDAAFALVVGDRFGSVVSDDVLGRAFSRRPDSADQPAARSTATARRTRIAATITAWRVCGCSRTRDDQPLARDPTLIGVELDRFIAEHWFVPLVADGALGGGVAGYMDVLGGIGFSQPVVGPVTGEVSLLAGAGGGGGLDTGGGLLLEPRVALVASRGGLGAQLALGRLVAPDGELSATTWSAGVAASSDALVLPRDLQRAIVAGVRGEPWRLSARAKTYLLPSRARVAADGGSLARSIDLVGIELERPLGGWVALTGQGYGACHGGAGGYAEGLFGLRIAHATPWWPRLSPSISADVGAGGGGGIDTGSGLIWDALAGGRLAISRAMDVGVEAGVADAARGSFTAAVATLSLTWTFARAVAE